MGAVLGWLGFGFGLISAILSYRLIRVAQSHDKHSTGWLLAGVTAVITLVFWGISMRTVLPFSPGQGLGLGFLIGGIASALALFFGGNIAHNRAETVELRAFLACAWGLVPVCLSFAIFWSYPGPPLIGCAIGSIMGGIVVGISMTDCCAGKSLDSLRKMMAVFSVFSAVLAVSVVLAVYHFDRDTARDWWGVPILLAVSACVAGYIGVQLAHIVRSERSPWLGHLLSVIVPGFVVTLLAWVYSIRLVQDWRLPAAVGVGSTAWLAVVWVVSLAEDATSDLASAPNRWMVGRVELVAVVGLLIAALSIVGFALWGGLGLGLGIISGFAVLIPALSTECLVQTQRERVEQTLLGALGFAVALVMFKLFVYTHRGELGSVDFRVHYSMVGAMLGLIIPVLLAGAAASPQHSPERKCARTDLKQLGKACALGLLAVASPILIVVIWELKAAIGFAFGLMASVFVMMLASALADSIPRRPRLDVLALLSIGALLSAIAFTDAFAYLGTERATRALILIVAAAVSAALVALSSLHSGRPGKTECGSSLRSAKHDGTKGTALKEDCNEPN